LAVAFSVPPATFAVDLTTPPATPAVALARPPMAPKGFLEALVFWVGEEPRAAAEEVEEEEAPPTSGAASSSEEAFGAVLEADAAAAGAVPGAGAEEATVPVDECVFGVRVWGRSVRRSPRQKNV